MEDFNASRGVDILKGPLYGILISVAIVVEKLIENIHVIKDQLPNGKGTI